MQLVMTSIRSTAPSTLLPRPFYACEPRGTMHPLFPILSEPRPGTSKGLSHNIDQDAADGLRPSGVVAASSVGVRALGRQQAYPSLHLTATFDPQIDVFVARIRQSFCQPSLTEIPAHSRPDAGVGRGDGRGKGKGKGEGEGKRDRCAAFGVHDLEDEGSMSRRSAGWSSTGSPILDPTASPRPLRRDSEQRPQHVASLPVSPILRSPASYGPSHRRSQQDSLSLPSFAPLARLQTQPEPSTGPSRSSRSSDVHSILNPSPRALSAETVPARRPAARIESPTMATARYTPSSLSRSPLTERGMDRPRLGILTELPSVTNGGHAPRRILAPHSPASRAMSLSAGSVRGTIDAQLSPFLPSQGSSYGRSQMAEPGSVDPGLEIAPLPTQSTLMKLQQGSGYTFLPTAPTPPPGGRRVSHGTVRTTHSQSASPSTSYSSFSQPSYTSPAPQYGSGLVHTAPGSGAPPTGSFGPTSLLVSRPPTPMASGESAARVPGHTFGQGNYQLLTLDTDQGPIQVPVDVQAASKLADDKRKRNAGASARFRQRRKEKERESSQTIAKLEQQIREITEQREFYRQERDHFRRIASGTLGPSVASQRPASPPQHVYPSYATSRDCSQGRSSIAGTWSDADASESGHEANVGGRDGSGGRRLTEPSLPPPPPSYGTGLPSLSRAPSMDYSSTTGVGGASRPPQPPPQSASHGFPGPLAAPDRSVPTTTSPDARLPALAPSGPPGGWYSDRDEGRGRHLS